MQSIFGELVSAQRKQHVFRADVSGVPRTWPAGKNVNFPSANSECMLLLPPRPPKLIEWFAKHQPEEDKPIERLISHDPENADEALLILRIATPKPVLHDMRPDRKQLLLEPWATQMGIGRKRGGLGSNDQDDVKRCTRDPDALVWPRSNSNIFPNWRER